MHRFISMLGRVCALGALLSSSAFAAASYSQNFSATPASWTTANDTWNASGDYRNTNGALPPSLAWYTGQTWTTNFTYKVRAYTDWPGTGNQVGVLFGLTDATHFHEVLVNANGDVGVYAASGNASSPTLLFPAGHVNGLAADTWFDLELFVSGNFVTVKVNGNVAIDHQPITPVAGKIGLVARSDLARFDDVLVTTMLFRGNFTQDDGTAIDLEEPDANCVGTCYVKISGVDSSGFQWPVRLWVGANDEGGLLQYISQSNTGHVTDYAGAQIETQIGHGGSNTHVLHQWLIKKGDKQPQIPYAIRPTNTFSQQHDLYMRFWLKYPYPFSTDASDNDYWQMPWQFVTDGTFGGGDARALRVSLFATRSPTYNKENCNIAAGSPLHWHWVIQGDQDPDHVLWQRCNKDSEVPMGRWFKVEIFFHRATSNNGAGRVWVAIDGEKIFEDTVNKTNSHGNPEGGMYAAGSPIVRINLPQMYGGDEWPREQFVDDVEIWNGFPSNASEHTE